MRVICHTSTECRYVQANLTGECVVGGFIRPEQLALTAKEEIVHGPKLGGGLFPGTFRGHTSVFTGLPVIQNMVEP